MPHNVIIVEVLMEFALQIGRLSSIDTVKNIDKYSRLYFGDDFCEQLLPDEKEFNDMLLLATKYKKNLTMVTSPMGQRSLDSLVKLLDKYQQSIYEFNFEIVFNDYGVFQVLSPYNSLKMVCGRVLARFKRDPRQYSIIDQLDSSFTQTNVAGNYIQNLFLQNKIYRIDMDWSQHIDVGFHTGGINYSVITPWTYLTTTRLCRLNEINLYDEDNRLRVGGVCSGICKNVEVKLRNQSMQKELLVIGNTQFYHVDVPPPEGANCFYNRIIEQRIDSFGEQDN